MKRDSPIFIDILLADRGVVRLSLHTAVKLAAETEHRSEISVQHLEVPVKTASKSNFR